MILFVDEQLPQAAARAMSLVGRDVRTNGDELCPGRGVGAPDAEIVAWCQAHGALLLTADRGRKNPEMLELLRRNSQPVVIVKPQRCTAERLLFLLLKHWEAIREAHGRAVELGKQTHGELNPSTGSFRDRRRAT